MCEITSILLLKKKGFAMTFLLFCSFFITENTFSIKHWNRNYIRLSYNNKAEVVLLNFVFFDLESSENKENGYLEWCKFEYTSDGENYKTFMRSDTYNQMPMTDLLYPKFWVTLTHKLDGAYIQIDECVVPKEGTRWVDSTNLRVAACIFFGTYAYTTVLWYLEGLNVKNIRLTGKWSVNGLYCPDYFCEVYDVSTTTPGQMLKTNNKALKVFKQAGAIVINGAAIGEKINVYTTSGVQIKSIVTSNELVTIKLPAKQVYLVNLGQTHYKIAL